MPLAMPLDGECRNCGTSELVWWSEDETEDTIELYVDCQECGYNYPKRFVNKSNDTSRDALESLAKKMI